MDIDKIRAIISRMELQEKIMLATGGPVTTAIDRFGLPSVSLTPELELYYAKEPSALALGCTFSHSLCAYMARVRSAVASRAGHLTAGTVACGVMTDPMRPDALDFFSEDAFLTAELLESYASAGFIGFIYTDPLGQGRYVNRTVDSRALYELYLYPLIIAGKYAAALQLDGGYLNGQKVASSASIAGIYCSYIPDDAMLITQYGDGDAADGTCCAYQLGATLDDRKKMLAAVCDGELDEGELDRGIERNVATVLKSLEEQKPVGIVPRDYNVIYDSTVLLKNDGTLPTEAKKITVFGDAKKFDDAASFSVMPISDAPKKYGAFNVFLITDYERDGVDHRQAEIICRVSAASTVVVVLCGGCATQLPIINSVSAVFFCPYCPSIFPLIGMMTVVSPRGHLPFTWCKSEGAYPCNNKRFRERGDFRYNSLYSGYTLFNNFANSDVLYPFGYGLEYTTYAISNYKVTSEGAKINIEFTVKNDGRLASTALLQAYITLQGGSIYGLQNKLAAFKRVPLERGESAVTTMTIDLAKFAVYDESNNALVPIGGKYRVDLGLSSVDIRASAEVKVAVGSRVNSGLPRTVAPAYYNYGEPFEPTAPEIERLLKVPFIKKPDEYPDLDPPEPLKIRHQLRKAERTTPARLLPAVRYKIEKTPIK